MELLTIAEIADKLGMPYEEGRQRIHYIVRRENIKPARRIGRQRLAMFDLRQVAKIEEAMHSENGK